MNRFETPNNRDYTGQLTKADLHEEWREIRAECLAEGMSEQDARKYADDYVAAMRTDDEYREEGWGY